MTEAQTILNLCKRFNCLPSALLNEDANLIQMLRIVELGGGTDEQYD